MSHVLDTTLAQELVLACFFVPYSYKLVKPLVNRSELNPNTATPTAMIFAWHYHNSVALNLDQDRLDKLYFIDAPLSFPSIHVAYSDNTTTKIDMRDLSLISDIIPKAPVIKVRQPLNNITHLKFMIHHSPPSSIAGTISAKRSLISRSTRLRSNLL